MESREGVVVPDTNSGNDPDPRPHRVPSPTEAPCVVGRLDGRERVTDRNSSKRWLSKSWKTDPQGLTRHSMHHPLQESNPPARKRRKRELPCTLLLWSPSALTRFKSFTWYTPDGVR